MKKYQVLENGDCIDLTDDEFQIVKNLLYYCDPCKSYHIENGFTMDDLVAKIKPNENK